VAEVPADSRVWILIERCSHRNMGTDTRAFQKRKSNFLATEPKERRFLSLLLGSGNELWIWERASGGKRKKNNKVEFLLPLTIQCHRQTPALARGVT